MCAQAGKPVYVEKPMAMDYTECQEMLDACRSARAPLFVAYYRRSLPRFLKVKDLLDAGVIGKVRGVTMVLYMPAPDEFDWHYRPEIGGGGKFVDMGCHTLDFLDYVLGPIRSVKGLAGNLGGHYPAEDIVTGAFEFESGVQAVGIWSFTTFNNFDRTEIVGSKGKISFSSFDAEPIVLTTNEGLTELAIDNPLHVHDYR
jgi:predicted dehydrogenase